MPSVPRYMIIEDACTFHVTWQCHDLQFFLENERSKRLYYNLLLEHKDRYRVKIYSYCFMSNHPHLTGYCEDKHLFSDFFRIVNSLFARKYNRWHGRRGQVVMDRFKSPRIDTSGDHLQVMFYNDLNPSRAGMVTHPSEYEWSSFHYYAFGQNDPLITPAPCYLELGRSPEERQKVYCSMVADILRCDWKEKKPYSSIWFIGNPEWVRRKSRDLRRARVQKIRDWLERRDAAFSNSS